ncbi:Uma2 family endonuclease [Micromonospora sp. L31]
MLSVSLTGSPFGCRLSAGPSARRSGRIPDLTVWRKPPPRGVWSAVAGVALVIEIVSPGSEAMDSVTKVREYATAGIPQYWVVDRDGGQTVTLHRLTGQGGYEERARMPLDWLLQTSPADHLD